MVIGEDANTLDRLVPLMAVSSWLRDFILLTPSFWNVIGSKRAKMIRRALEKSGVLPLKVYLDGLPFTSSLAEVFTQVRNIVPQSQRIVVLSFVNFGSFVIDRIAPLLVTPNLRTFSAFLPNSCRTALMCAPPPALRNLSLARIALGQKVITRGCLQTLHLVETLFYPALGLSNFVELLQCNSSLEVLSLESIQGLESREGGVLAEQSVMELQHLRHLSLSGMRGKPLQTLCSVLRTPNLQTARLQFIKDGEEQSDQQWLSSILGPGEPSSMFIGRCLQQAPSITLVISRKIRNDPDSNFDLFDIPGTYLQLGGVKVDPGLILQNLEASYPLESIQAPITLKLGPYAPLSLGVKPCLLGPSVVCLLTLCRLTLRDDYMVQDVLAHLSSAQYVTANGVFRWPCPKLKGLSLPSSTMVGDTIVREFIRRRYAVVDGHTKSLLEPRQTERLEFFGVFGRIGEGVTWSAFVDEVARFTGTRIRIDAPHGSPSSLMYFGHVREFNYELIPLETSPGWSRVPGSGESAEAAPIGS
ncbi:hypothetical protein FRB95_013451 [Tulasnella sp. JGI-2019a]|nr:hypothetical protein FRB95_013451 [Tulasnella sp. JGI-2019a]